MVWEEAWPSWFRIQLLGRTILYNSAVAVLAVVLALPAAVVLGRGKGWAARGLWLLLPVALLLPSITYAYGWIQCLRMMKITPAAGGVGDVLRCIWTLATWLWALPAGVMGLALRQVDVQVQEQALLEGAMWRVTARQLAGPALAAAAMVGVLALQEFSVYEPTGISVIATEVRMVFDTGAYSSADNSMAISGGAGVWEKTSQAQRAAAAVSASVPLLIVLSLLSAGSIWGVRRLEVDQAMEAPIWPKCLDAGKLSKLLALAVVLLAVAVPMVSLVVSRKRTWEMAEVWESFRPQILGSMAIAGVTGAIGLGLALWSMVRSDVRLLGLGLAGFVVGGQLLAIAQIRLYNHGPLERWFYNGPGIVVTAYLARFGWLALAAGLVSWSAPWRMIREMAAVDGAGPWATVGRVIWPLIWPFCVAGGVLLMVLGLTEVPATVLLAPVRPPMLIPMLMGWVHMQRSDEMIDGSLLLVGFVMVFGTAAVGILAMTLRGRRWIPFRKADE